MGFAQDTLVASETTEVQHLSSAADRTGGKDNRAHRKIDGRTRWILFAETARDRK